MKGILIYTPEDAARNKWFIDSLIRAGSGRGCGIKLCTSASDIPEDIDFAVNRSRCSRIADELEERGVVVFNSSLVTEVTNDKWDAYCFLRGRVPMAETCPAGDTSPVGFPCILKPRHGHGGKDIFLAEDAGSYSGALDRILSTSYTDFAGDLYYEEAIVQPVLDKGRDLRVYVLGGKVIASVLRTSDRDFRSNYSLGGRAELAEPGEEVMKITDTLCGIFRFGLAGIDFIFDGGKPVLNEIEDAVGSRMLYALRPDMDVPGLYIGHILDTLG